MIRGVEADLRAVGGIEEPAGLERVIRPERGVEVVGEDTDVGREGFIETGHRDHVRERAGVVERGWQRGAGDDRAPDRESLDLTIGDVRREHVAIGRIKPEGDQVGVREEIFEADGVGAVRGQRPDVTAGIIGENVAAVQTRQPRAAVENAAGDGIALVGGAAVRVFEDGRDGAEIRGGLAGLGSIDGSFAISPAIISTAHADNNFLAQAPAHVTDVERAGGPVEGDAPRIAQAHHPELGAQRGGVDRRAIERGRPDPRIVRGDEIIRHVHQRSVRGGREVGAALVHVEAQEAREEILVDALAVVPDVVLAALIAE